MEHQQLKYKTTIVPLEGQERLRRSALDKNDKSKNTVISDICFATKIKLQLSTYDQVEISNALLNIRTLNSNWIDSKGWEACHVSDSDMMGFFASSLIRYCRVLNITQLCAVETLDIFRAYGGSLDARCVPLNFLALNQILYASEKDCKGNADAEFFQTGAFSSLLIFPIEERHRFAILRDYSTCVTIAGPKDFIEHMVALSRRTWFDGVPFDGFVPRDARVRQPAMSRYEWMKSFRSAIDSAR